MIALGKNVGAEVKVLTASTPTAVTAGGAGDNSAITGQSVDRDGYQSCVFAISYVTTLGAAETLKFAAEYQESSDNSSWGTATSLQAATTAETGLQTAKHGVVEFNLALAGKKRYIRFNQTPDLSRANTDTAVVAGTVTLGGAVTLPA